MVLSFFPRMLCVKKNNKFGISLQFQTCVLGQTNDRFQRGFVGDLVKGPYRKRFLRGWGSMQPHRFVTSIKSDPTRFSQRNVPKLNTRLKMLNF